MSKRKYRKGRQITSIADFDKSGRTWFIVKYGTNEKTTHVGWVESWQYHCLKNMIETGRIFEAMEIGEGGDDEKA